MFELIKYVKNIFTWEIVGISIVIKECEKHTYGIINLIITSNTLKKKTETVLELE